MIEELDKAELHVHLEGTLEAAELLRMARENDVDVPYTSVEDVDAAYEFSSLQSFLDVFFQGCRVLRRRDDFADLATTYLRRAAADGVTRAEVFFGPQTFLANGIPLEDQLEGLFDGFARAHEETGIDAALVASAQRHRSEDDALAMLEVVMPWADRIVGFGLGSSELGNPPSKFLRYFTTARERGFRTTCHAGEEGPTSYVWEALDLCHVDRIDHGVAIASDPALVDRVVRDQVPLTMCPVSNLRLKVVPDLASHPIRELFDAGALVTVNSDDPTYFGAHVGDNYRRLRDEAGFSEAELAQLARNSVIASWT